MIRRLVLFTFLLVPAVALAAEPQQPAASTPPQVDTSTPLPPGMTVGELMAIVEAQVAQALAQDKAARAAPILRRIQDSVKRP